ncbi:hypothetical protein GCM10009592_14260 [Brachybacterium rhamnosum]
MLAHELGHAHYNDVGPQGDREEARAWRFAARHLVDVDSYAAAEQEHGPHPGALAAALGVTPDVVKAFQSMMRSLL